MLEPLVSGNCNGEEPIYQFQNQDFWVAYFVMCSIVWNQWNKIAQQYQILHGLCCLVDLQLGSSSMLVLSWSTEIAQASCDIYHNASIAATLVSSLLQIFLSLQFGFLQFFSSLQFGCMLGVNFVGMFFYCFVILMEEQISNVKRKVFVSNQHCFLMWFISIEARFILQFSFCFWSDPREAAPYN